jgi:hypothetical protein
MTVVGDMGGVEDRYGGEVLAQAGAARHRDDCAGAAGGDELGELRVVAHLRSWAVRECPIGAWPAGQGQVGKAGDLGEPHMGADAKRVARREDRDLTLGVQVFGVEPDVSSNGRCSSAVSARPSCSTRARMPGPHSRTSPVTAPGSAA